MPNEHSVPYDPLVHVSADIGERASRIGLVCLDVDGTMTDGRLYFDSIGKELKSFSVLDGQGLNQLLRFGIKVVMITARPSLVAEARAMDLGLESHIGVRDKLATMESVIERHGMTRERTCFVGDDLPDLDCLRVAGLSVAPATAHPWITESVHWITRARAGEGAVREVCDVILAAQGHVPAILAGYGSRDGRRA